MKCATIILSTDFGNHGLNAIQNNLYQFIRGIPQYLKKIIKIP